MTDSTDRKSDRKSDRKNDRKEAPERDLEDLSALLDGELSPAREAELRARMSERPELAEAFALMGGADQQLRDLAGRPVAEDRLARMRAGLDAKLAADEGEWASGAVVIAFPNRGRWMAAAAAALAAGLALYLVVDRPSANGPTVVSERIAEVPAPVESLAEPDRIAQGAPNGTAAANDGPEVVDPPALARAPDLIEESTSVLDTASEEEIAIALDYETLTDFEVIARLELLELLDDLDTVEAM
jgi:anti-sigma factor RsiW